MRLRFSLRTLMVLVFILSILFALYAREVRRVAVRQAAIDKIEDSGGFTLYCYRNTGLKPRKPVPGSWIERRLFGYTSAAKLEVVQFHYNRIPTLTEEEIIALIRPFRAELKHLILSDTCVTDHILEELLDYPRLEIVTLCQTKVSNEAVLHFHKARPKVWITHPAFNEPGKIYYCDEPRDATAGRRKVEKEEEEEEKERELKGTGVILKN